MTIETGDILPVDGIVTISNDIGKYNFYIFLLYIYFKKLYMVKIFLKIIKKVMDESSATGESDPVKKRVPKNFDDAK